MLNKHDGSDGDDLMMKEKKKKSWWEEGNRERWLLSTITWLPWSPEVCTVYRIAVCVQGTESRYVYGVLNHGIHDALSYGLVCYFSTFFFPLQVSLSLLVSITSLFLAHYRKGENTCYFIMLRNSILVDLTSSTSTLPTGSVPHNCKGLITGFYKPKVFFLIKFCFPPEPTHSNCSQILT